MSMGSAMLRRRAGLGLNLLVIVLLPLFDYVPLEWTFGVEMGTVLDWGVSSWRSE